MSDFLKAIILGVVEGITEFLPISSTGHLIIVNQWISFGEEFTKMFDVVIQLGAILAVVVFFWDRLWPFGKYLEQRKAVFMIWKKAIVAVAPALVLGFLFSDTIESKFFNPITVAAMLILGGVLLLLLDRRKGSSDLKTIGEMGYGTVFLIGLAQSIAMIPGTSRSAATILGGLLLGLSRSAATEFSFFLAIPTMAAASAYSLVKSEITFGGQELAILAVGFVTAFLVAWVVVKMFMGYVRKHDLHIFGYYRIMLGLLLLFYFLPK